MTSSAVAAAGRPLTVSGRSATSRGADHPVTRGATGPPSGAGPQLAWCAMTTEPHPLGAYLRARRALVTPERVGLPNAGRRRVSGLRREEVALLAGISADYYLRLERGRDTHPSPQVLESLARVLQLDDVERDYLLSLVQPERRARPRRRIDRVPPRLHHLLAMVDLPAFVEGRPPTSSPPTRSRSRSTPACARARTACARSCSTRRSGSCTRTGNRPPPT